MNRILYTSCAVLLLTTTLSYAQSINVTGGALIAKSGIEQSINRKQSQQAIQYNNGNAQNTPTGNSGYRGASHGTSNYPYIEGSSYVSPFVNNTGEYTGVNPDSRCYHGNYGYNGQTSNYDHSSCVVVYDGDTYVRLLKGSGAAGGTAFFGN